MTKKQFLEKYKPIFVPLGYAERRTLWDALTRDHGYTWKPPLYITGAMYQSQKQMIKLREKFLNEQIWKGRK